MAQDKEDSKKACAHKSERSSLQVRITDSLAVCLIALWLIFASPKVVHNVYY